MKKCKYVWLYGSPDDYLTLRERFNHLASQGWELKKTTDGRHFFGIFLPTKRTELRYDVEPRTFCSEEELEAMVALRAAQGWEAICTINDVNIYCSMPCRTPECAENIKENNRHAAFLNGLQSVLFLLSAAFSALWNRWHPVWYLDHLSAFLHLTWIPVTVCALCLVFWGIFRGFRPALQPSKSVFYVLRCGMLGLIRIWWLILPVAIVFALLPLPWAVGVLAGEIIFCLLFRFYGILAPGCVLLLTLLLSILLPSQQLSSLNGMAWRNLHPDIVTAETLALSPQDFIVAEYEKQGSFLVQRASYSEKWKELRIESKKYSCVTLGLADQVEGDLRDELPNYTIVRNGKEIAALWVSESLTQEQLTQAAQTLLNPLRLKTQS
ncbi:MAG: DUF2812 domain-containing protein [Oscillospiraceae bacterium]|nr:DUF2812 domain-containing protein [Oscillospiraceae bacterium]